MSEREKYHSEALIRNLASSYLGNQTSMLFSSHIRQKYCHHHHQHQQQLSNSVFHPFNNQPVAKNNFCVRFAVNGLSKFTKGNTIPQMNRSIQAGNNFFSLT